MVTSRPSTSQGPSNPEQGPDHTLSEATINAYIRNRIDQFRHKGYNDYELWENFREDFATWNQTHFIQATTDLRRDLRDFLRANGCFVAKGGLISKTLTDIIEDNEHHTWTPEEVEDQLRVHKQFNSRWNPNSQGTMELPTFSRPQPTEPIRPQILVPIPQPQEPQPVLISKIPDTQSNTTKRLTDLIKFYGDDSQRYGGDLYDTIDGKLQVFYDYCQKVGIDEQHYDQAFSVMLKNRASDYYHTTIVGRYYDFRTMVSLIKSHFETEENHQFYLSEWRETTLPGIISENSNQEKSKLQCLELLFTKLQRIQRVLNPIHYTDLDLRNQVLSACRGVEECNLALYKPAPTFESLCTELRSAIGTATRSKATRHFVQEDGSTEPDDESYDQNWTDRTYGGRGRRYGRPRGRFRTNRGSYRSPPYKGTPYKGTFTPKKCYVCGKIGCYSTKHTSEERQQAYARFKGTTQYVSDQDLTPVDFQTFLAQYEGVEGFYDKDYEVSELHQDLLNLEIDKEASDSYFTEFGTIDGNETMAFLANQSTFHVVTKQDVFYETPSGTTDTTFTFTDRYSASIFQGIMPDTGASGVSTAGFPQFQALQGINSTIQLDTSQAGQHKIRFGKGEAISQGIIRVPTPVGTIIFHVLPTNTPFLFCIHDMDILQVKFDNLRNVLVQGDKIIPIVRKWGHPWMLLDEPERTLAWSHLTESELRQLHRRFGHPSVGRLTKILSRAGQEFEAKAIKHLTKYCHQCQMYGKAPGRFKFTLKDDYEFNYSVVIDVLYLESKPVLQVVDSATAFQAARFLKDLSAKTAWDTLRTCWIDTYQGPPEYIIHDAGRNFSSTEFRQHAKAMDITVKEVPVEAHNSVGKVERYHTPLRRCYEILRNELGDDLNREAVLQMAIKAINDSAGPDGIIPTLLVFGAYPRIGDTDPPTPSIIARAKAIQVAMKELRRLHATRQVKEGLSTRNGPDTSLTLDLPINSDVRVWREKDGWTGPYRLLATNRETCTIHTPTGPTNFRSTVVRPYYTKELPDPDPMEELLNRDPTDNATESGSDPVPTTPTANNEPQAEAQPRGRGRPKGSKNKLRNITDLRRSERPQPTHESDDTDDELALPTAFITTKERSDQELSLKLRKEGVITTPGAPFEESQKQEIEGLKAKGVFDFVQHDPIKHHGQRIFKSRLVNEVKGKATNTPYEKSRLVIQAYNDEGKEIILTQSPTIQRVSQRLMIALAPSLAKIQNLQIDLWLRDITQAYVQSTTLLQRLILAELPVGIKHEYPPGTIMVVLRPLYGIPEAGTHWWATYYKHHQQNLCMATSTYDPCLLITESEDRQTFGIVGMQTDDTLIIASDEFHQLEERELHKAGLQAKPKEKLDIQTPLMFNGCIIQKNNTNIELRQKGQGKRLQLVDSVNSPNTTDQTPVPTEHYLDITKPDPKQQYIEQRARGAYIATICQPEAAFDLSIAAQCQEPTQDDVTKLNKRIQWQIDHLDRGVDYIPLDLATVKLFVFVDGSFANNKDLSSQIGYEIILANESTGDDSFEIKGNLIHWSSIKSKRVTRSVLASEIYGMVSGVDMAVALNTTLRMILNQLRLDNIPTIVCTDSYSLYECLVKLGTTQEKRLMIDVMALRQSYERRELQEVRWIRGQDNPADAMTKAGPNKALETFINTNSLKIQVEGWVERGTEVVTE